MSHIIKFYSLILGRIRNRIWFLNSDLLIPAPPNMDTESATLTLNRIIVKCRRTGGAFGGKERCAVAIMAAVAAHKLGRPCRLVLPREVDVDVTGHRHEVQAAYSCSFTREGRIVEAETRCEFNAGFSMDLSGSWALILAMRIDGGYTLKNFSVTTIPR